MSDCKKTYCIYRYFALDGPLCGTTRPKILSEGVVIAETSEQALVQATLSYNTAHPEPKVEDLTILVRPF